MCLAKHDTFIPRECKDSQPYDAAKAPLRCGSKCQPWACPEPVKGVVIVQFTAMAGAPCSGCDGMALSLACSAAVTAALKALISALIVLRFAAFATPPPTHIHTYTRHESTSRPPPGKLKTAPPPHQPQTTSHQPPDQHHRRKSYRIINHQPFGPIPQLSPMRAWSKSALKSMSSVDLLHACRSIPTQISPGPRVGAEVTS